MRTGCVSEKGLSSSALNATLETRFLAKCGEPDANGCINWLASKTKTGYGIVTIDGDGTRTCAHRVAWVLKNGDLAPGELVLHKCDNRSCVNADHLFVGSAKENTADMVTKGRHFWRNKLPWQKLNATDGERIRDLRRMGHTQQEIADWLGVSRPLISMIEHGKIGHSALSY